MAVLEPLEYEDGRDSLSDFLQYLMDKHKNEETRYVAPLIKVVKDFEKYGSKINLFSSKKFPPFRVIKGEEFAELRTKECRYFIYHDGNDVWKGLHGYEKEGNNTPNKERLKARKEVRLWKETKKRK